MSKLSVIIPAFNVENHISKCLDSILAQTFEDFEIIIVDDGSEDKSGSICNYYADLDKRIQVYHQSNMGVSTARNVALAKAKGKYISFIDADDFIEKTMFQKMIDCMETTNAEICCCNFDRIYENGIIEVNDIRCKDGILNSKEFVRHIFDSPRTIGGCIWNKVFLRKKITESFDENIKICEDNLFLANYCKNINSAYVLTDILYHSYQRTNSITRSKKYNVEEELFARKKIISIMDSFSKELRHDAEADYLDCLFRVINSNDNYCLNAIYDIKKYLQNNRMQVLFNKKIGAKLKVRYFSYIFNILKE